MCFGKWPDAKAKSTILIEHIASVKCPVMASRRTCFVIQQTGGRTDYYTSADERDMQLWATSIESAIAKLNRRAAKIGVTLLEVAAAGEAATDVGRARIAAHRHSDGDSVPDGPAELRRKFSLIQATRRIFTRRASVTADGGTERAKVPGAPAKPKMMGTTGGQAPVNSTDLKAVEACGLHHSRLVHQLRTTTDVAEAIQVIRELHAIWHDRMPPPLLEDDNTLLIWRTAVSSAGTHAHKNLTAPVWAAEIRSLYLALQQLMKLRCEQAAAAHRRTHTPGEIHGSSDEERHYHREHSDDDSTDSSELGSDADVVSDLPGTGSSFLRVEPKQPRGTGVAEGGAGGAGGAASPNSASSPMSSRPPTGRRGHAFSDGPSRLNSSSYYVELPAGWSHPHLTSLGPSPDSPMLHVYSKKTRMTRRHSTDQMCRFVDMYAMGRELGRGNYGVVNEATHIASGKQFAVKSVRISKMSKADRIGLEKEIGLLRRLRHPHIVRLHAVFREGGKILLVFDLLLGGELLDFLAKEDTYSEADAAELAVTILDAVGYCHRMGVVHRDLKPENIVVKGSRGEDPSLKIIDFGFANEVAGQSMESLVTRCGTPAYVAPEILAGRPYGATADMWSVGVILYMLLCGYPPFQHKNQAIMFRQIRAGVYKFHSPHWDEVSDEAKDLVSKLLVVDPDKRLTAVEAAAHPWCLATSAASDRHLSQVLRKLREFNARRRFRAAGMLVRSGIRLRKASEASLLRRTSSEGSDHRHGGHDGAGGAA